MNNYWIPYLLFLILIFFHSIPISSTAGRRILLQNKVENIFVVFISIVFFGFRGYLGTDYQEYYRAYNIAPSLFDNFKILKDFFTIGRYHYWEKGFLFLIVLCKTMAPNYFFLQVVSATIDICLLYVIFKKYLDRRIVLGFIFFFLFSGIPLIVNNLRNIKSIIIFLLSLKYIKEKKFIYFLIMNIIGCLFHISSIIYIPFYFILNKDWSRKIIIFSFVLGNIIYILQIEWIRSIINFCFQTFSANNPYLKKLMYYTYSDFFSQKYGYGFGYFERFFSFCFILYFYKKLVFKNPINKVFINSMFIYCFIFLYLSEMQIFLQRLPFLFVFSYWIIYPQIYELLSKKNKLIFIIIMIIYAIIKCIKDNSIIMIYENILLPSYSSFEEHAKVIKEWSKTYMRIK